jgi:hypothetical protein
VVIQRGHQQKVPKVLHGLFGLAMLVQPLFKGYFLQIRLVTIDEFGPCQGQRNPEFIPEAQVGVPQEGGR